MKRVNAGFIVCKHCKHSLGQTRRRMVPVATTGGESACFDCGHTNFHLEPPCGMICADEKPRCQPCVEKFNAKERRAKAEEARRRKEENAEERQKQLPCLTCKEHRPLARLVVCSNQGRNLRAHAQHHECILLDNKPIPDVEWNCDTCILKASKCHAQKCLFQSSFRSKLSHLMECIECEEAYHFDCMNLRRQPTKWTCSGCKSLMDRMESSSESERETSSDEASVAEAKPKSRKSGRKATSSKKRVHKVTDLPKNNNSDAEEQGDENELKELRNMSLKLYAGLKAISILPSTPSSSGFHSKFKRLPEDKRPDRGDTLYKPFTKTIDSEE